MATAAMVDGGAVRSLPPQPPLLSPRFTDAVTTTGLFARISLPSSGSRPTANRQQPAEQQLVEQQPADHSLPTDSSPPTSS